MTKFATPYEALGEEGIRQLANAFYDILDELPEARTIRRMHKNDLSSIKEKLADYLIGWMGGPPRYLEKHGTVCLTDPHQTYAIGPDERDQWLLCMDKALSAIDASDELKDMLREPFYRVADTVRNREASSRHAKDPNIIATG